MKQLFNISLMKRHFLSVLCGIVFLVLASCSSSNIWDNPVYFNENIGYWGKLTKVELLDNETVLHFRTEYVDDNGMAPFAESTVLRTADGQTFKILNGKATSANEADVVIGEPIMPNDGHGASFALHFEPLPAGTSCFDLDGCSGSDSYKCWTIRPKLVEPEIPAEWKDVKYVENETFPDVNVGEGISHISVKCLGYRSGMDISAVVESWSMLLGAPRARHQDYSFDAENSILTMDIPLSYPRQVDFILFGVSSISGLVVNPGDSLELLVDIYNKENPVLAVKGFLAKTNMQIANTPKESLEDIFNSSLSADNSQARLDAIISTASSKIDKINKSSCTDAYKQLSIFEVEYIAYQSVDDYVDHYLMNQMKSGNISFENPQQYEEAIQQYSSMVDVDAKDALVKKMMSEYSCFNSPYAPFWSMFFLAPINAKEGEVSLRTDLHNAFMKVMDPTYDGVINNKVCQELVEKAVSEMFAGMGVIEDLTNREEFEIPVSQIVPVLMDMHPGKVILVDVWETWCAPCRKAHKAMAPLKEELKDKDIDFVYISSPSSDKDKLTTMIKDISGHHLFVSEDVQQYIMNMAKSQAVPTYLVFDKNGMLVQIFIGFPGEDAMKQTLLQALGE